jgi:hypothetical protein
MDEQEAIQILVGAFGNIDLVKVRQALLALSTRRAFVTSAHREQLVGMLGTLQQLQSSFQQMGFIPRPHLILSN